MYSGCDLHPEGRYSGASNSQLSRLPGPRRCSTMAESLSSAWLTTAATCMLKTLSVCIATCDPHIEGIEAGAETVTGKNYYMSVLC